MKQGFTLLELLIVMVIIGILAIIAIPKYLDAVETAHQTALVANLKECREAGLMYASFFNADPSDVTSIGIDINNDGEFEKEYSSQGVAIDCSGVSWTDGTGSCTGTSSDGYTAVIDINTGEITWN
ncbi:MAG: prepilin-type N-terminal cleavage/methylation domain-containing protein [Candidatus Omnitrophica bacterium]|nr:prepilin-type N-terminal cleavage/methylation domain-containing protein [Candidatus Omnitrophota bacterium]